jgi:hypothetical protein
MSTPHFRFMHLPPELRLVVYENITLDTRTLIKTHSRHPLYNWHSIGGYSVTLTRRSLPLAILATCKSINLEVRSIMRTKLRHLAQQPIHIKLDHELLAWIAKWTSSGPPTFSSLQSLCEPCLPLLEHIRDVAQPVKGHRHVEIALERPKLPQPDINLFPAWVALWKGALGHGISCVLFHKGVIPPTGSQFTGQPLTGLQEWAVAKRWTRELPNHINPGSVAKLEELDEAEWDRMVASWSEA